MSIQNNELPQNPSIESETVRPFRRFCTTIMTIGTIPSSYQEAMGYQELLVWFCDFLQNKVIPAFDNNANAIKELQNLYVELKSYVDNYFNNLDVQEEINNKLDEMFSNGQLSDLIEKYINPIVNEQNKKLENMQNTIYLQNNTINAQNTKFSNMQQEIDTNSSRIDKITKLPAGSTSGDAELIDIRTGYNGKVYSNAGTSVRTQIKDIHNGMTEAIFTCGYAPILEFTNLLDNKKQVKITVDAPYNVFYENKRYGGTSQLVLTHETIYTLVLLLFNISTKEFTMQDYNIPIPENCKICAFIDVSNQHILNNINVIGYPDTKPAGLMPNFSGETIKVNTTDKTITFPNDTLLFFHVYNKKHWVSLQNQVISYDGFGTSALKLYYDILEDKLVFSQYSTLLIEGSTNIADKERYVFIGTFRTTSGTLGINIPYEVDGKLFGLNLENYINFPNNHYLQSNKNIYGINHRGFNTVAPENTIPAFKLSKQKGFNFVETDVNFTSDNVPVLLHDDTIDRTSNGTGNINDMTYEQVLQYDFGSWKSATYTGTKIPTFDEFMKLCRNLGLHPYIELKGSTKFTQENIQKCVDIVKKYNMQDSCTWICFNPTYLEMVKNIDNSMRLGLIANSDVESVYTSTLNLKTDNNEIFLSMYYTNISDNVINKCLENNLRLECWTINNETDINNMNGYVSGFTSDNLNASSVLLNNSLN